MKIKVGICAAAAFWAVSAWGQVGSSTISGRVVDTTGAVVPTVKVSAVQVATNFTFNAVTNADGLYRIPSLQPGAYRVSFEAAGFKKIVRDDVDLRTGDNLAVDMELQVGSVSESVEVKGNTQLLETETSAVGSLVEGDVLHKLPLYQRYVNTTLNLVPGMTMGGYGYGGDFTAFHIAGQRNTTIGLFEDGVNANEQMSGNVGIKPVQNSVEEVKVLTTTLPAEYGHSAGGVLAVVKKSGTNQLHGLASDYGRTRRMQHRLVFRPLAHVGPAARQSEWRAHLVHGPGSQRQWPGSVSETVQRTQQNVFLLRLPEADRKEGRASAGQHADRRHEGGRRIVRRRRPADL